MLDLTVLSPAQRAVMVRATVLLKNNGFDPNQPRDDQGQWTDTGGGGSGGGGSGKPFSAQIRTAEAHLKQATEWHNMIARGNPGEDDDDLKEAKSQVQNFQIKLNALRQQQANAIADEMRRKERATLHMPNQDKPRTFTPGADLGDKRTEAERLRDAENRKKESEAYVRSGQERRRFENTTNNANNNNNSRPYVYGQEFYDRNRANATISAISSNISEDPQSLREAIRQTSARIARTSHQITSIMGNVHGIANNPRDFAGVGAKLRNIQEDLRGLNQNIRLLPGDTRSLYRETVSSVVELQGKIKRLQSKLKTKFSRPKPKKKK